MYINEQAQKIIDNHRITVTATRGSKPAKWTPAGNHYSVKVKIGNKSATFDYWDSYDNRKRYINNMVALQCFASDAQTHMNTGGDVDEYAAEFGYKPSEANRVAKGCKKAYEALTRLGLDEDEIYTLASMGDTREDEEDE